MRDLRKPTEQYSIFVVDDMEVILKLISHSLKCFNVKTFKNAEEALNVLTTEKPDLIITDVEMPKINGFEFCRKIKADPELSHIPVIFLTSLDQNTALAEALSSGGTDFIDKNTIKGEAVKLRIENVLKLQEFANEGLELAAETKKFLRVICHDVANPLSVVKSYAHILEKKLQAANAFEPHEKYFTKMSKAILQIQNILEDVRSTYARAEKGEQLEVKNVSLKTVVDNLVYIIQDKIAQKELFLDVFPIDANLKVIAHEGILQNQILGNLLSNAIKFTKKGGNISVLTEASENEVNISVIDSGVGIPSDLMQILFDPSQNTSRPGTDDEKGTGFGLPIVKDYIEQMGGAISVSSNDIAIDPSAHGTTFKVTLKKSVA